MRSGCTLSEVERGGLPTFLERFRRRYALLGRAGPLSAGGSPDDPVCAGGGWAGNLLRVPSAAILSTLRRLGVRPGAFGPALEINYIEQRALLELEGLSWMSINLHGARAEVLVRERVKAPELVDGTDRRYHRRDRRVVTRLEVLAGETERKVGEPVAKGDVLIRGNVCCWRGPCTANRTWLAAGPGPGTGGGPDLAHPSGIHSPHGPGQGVHRAGDRAVVSHRFGKTHQFYRNSGISFPQYDKISSTWNAGSGIDLVLPLSLSRETMREYTLTPAEVDLAAAQEMLEAQLERALTEQIEGKHHADRVYRRCDG